jgi:hypothetical protein
VLVGVFILGWIITEVGSPLFNNDKPIFGWGDILLFPPFFVVCEVLFGSPVIGLGLLYASIFVFTAMFWSYWKKEGVPVALSLCAGFCLLLIAKIFYAVITSS